MTHLPFFTPWSRCSLGTDAPVVRATCSPVSTGGAALDIPDLGKKGYTLSVNFSQFASHAVLMINTYIYNFSVQIFQQIIQILLHVE